VLGVAAKVLHELGARDRSSEIEAARRCRGDERGAPPRDGPPGGEAIVLVERRPELEIRRANLTVALHESVHARVLELETPGQHGCIRLDTRVPARIGIARIGIARAVPPACGQCKDDQYHDLSLAGRHECIVAGRPGAPRS
jgi:hypothetical protein